MTVDNKLRLTNVSLSKQKYKSISILPPMRKKLGFICREFTAGNFQCQLEAPSIDVVIVLHTACIRTLQTCKQTETVMYALKNSRASSCSLAKK